jgi:hypothetical protein
MTLRIAHEIRYDVGVEQKLVRHSATGSGAGSSISGKSSAIGSNWASTSSRDFGGDGSMINRSPSLCKSAVSPDNSNSRGMRTAWLRPLVNNLTVRTFDGSNRRHRSDLAKSDICLSICQTRAQCSVRATHVALLPTPLHDAPALRQQPRGATRLCQFAHAQNIALPLGDRNHAAGVKQVEDVARLDALVVGGQ